MEKVKGWLKGVNSGRDLVWGDLFGAERGRGSFLLATVHGLQGNWKGITVPSGAEGVKSLGGMLVQAFPATLCANVIRAVERLNSFRRERIRSYALSD